jgi:membrane protease YdiL (CAAX protease family)
MTTDRELDSVPNSAMEPTADREPVLTRRDTTAAGWLGAAGLAGFGIAFLLMRSLAVQGDLPLVPVLGFGFGLLLMASVRDRGEPSTRAQRMWPAGVLIAGCATVTLVVAFGGPHAGSLSGGAVVVTCLASIAEEAFFRRFLYERLHAFGAAAAVLGSALLFAATHIPAYGLGAFPVDLGAGLLFGWQRWSSGSWKVPAATHLLANLEVMFR